MTVVPMLDQLQAIGCRLSVVTGSSGLTNRGGVNVFPAATGKVVERWLKGGELRGGTVLIVASYGFNSFCCNLLHSDAQHVAY